MLKGGSGHERTLQFPERWAGARAPPPPSPPPPSIGTPHPTPHPHPLSAPLAFQRGNIDQSRGPHIHPNTKHPPDPPPAALRLRLPHPSQPQYSRHCSVAWRRRLQLGAQRSQEELSPPRSLAGWMSSMINECPPPESTERCGGSRGTTRRTS